jgi:hypothetical protein
METLLSRTTERTSTLTLHEQLLSRLDDLLYELELDYSYKNHKYISMLCPVHGGDNSSACSIYFNTGIWNCHTHNCHSKYRNNLIGLINGVLDFKYSKKHSQAEIMDYVKKFLASEPKHIINKEQIIHKEEKVVIKVPREKVLSTLTIPSKYYLDRGYSKEILVKYDVGDYRFNGQPLSHRAIFPIYDSNNENMIGCTGRSKFPRCEKCKLYHANTYACPEGKYVARYGKWKHQTGFLANENLYNIHNARPHIIKYGKVIVVESPGNVLRLEEAGIHISVACFGVKFSLQQRMLLDSVGAFDIIVISDDDSAGDSLVDKVRLVCGPLYNIFPLKPQAQDVGEMKVKQILEWKELWNLLS